MKICPCVCVSLAKAFVLYLLDSKESISWRRDGYFTGNLNRISQRMKFYWLKLTLAMNKNYQLYLTSASSVCGDLFIRLLSTYLLLSTNVYLQHTNKYMHCFLDHRQGRTFILRLQLCINSGDCMENSRQSMWIITWFPLFCSFCNYIISSFPCSLKGRLIKQAEYTVE